MNHHKAQINIVFKQNKKNENQTKELDLDQHQILKKFQKELDGLIGLQNVKKIIEEIYALLYISDCRKLHGLKTNKQALHMIFKGNPGTGKTTIARIFGKLFFDMNVLSKGHFIEAERADLVGEYIGHTAKKTRELINKAKGGILFIDEAYSLSRGGSNDFGKEAIDTLVKGMEDHYDDLLVILAGYPREMNYFLSQNPGLPSRFPIIIDFKDYTVEELIEIAKQMVMERDYILANSAEQKLYNHIHHVIHHDDKGKFSNGRYVRNIIENAIRKQAVRLLRENDLMKDELILIKEIDLHIH